MILAMRPDATLDQIEHAIERVKELGFKQPDSIYLALTKDESRQTQYARKLVEVSVNVNLDVLDTSQRHRVTQQQDRVAALADFMGRGKQLTISVTSD